MERDRQLRLGDARPQSYLARPFLEEDGKKEDEIIGLFSEEETEFAAAAQALLESVRAKLNRSNV